MVPLTVCWQQRYVDTATYFSKITAIQWVALAWQEVKGSTIQKSFRHAGISHTLMTLFRCQAQTSEGGSFHTYVRTYVGVLYLIRNEGVIFGLPRPKHLNKVKDRGLGSSWLYILNGFPKHRLTNPDTSVLGVHGLDDDLIVQQQCVVMC